MVPVLATFESLMFSVPPPVASSVPEFVVRTPAIPSVPAETLALTVAWASFWNEVRLSMVPWPWIVLSTLTRVALL